MKTHRWQKISKLWQSVSTGSINRKIFSAALIVAGGTLFVKLIAVGKELVVASQFGTADELDAFLIALVIPSVLINIVGDCFDGALIPIYIKVRDQEGKVAAQRLFAGAMVGSFGLLLIAAYLLVSLAPVYLPLLTGGFSPKKLELTYQLLWLMSPMILITGINTIWGAVLNAGERFALVALAPILTPTVTIILLLTMKVWGVFNLATGMVLGQLLEMMVIGATLHRQGISLLPKWSGFEDNLKQVAIQYLPSMMAGLLMTSSSVIDKSMAAMLPAGSISALGYADRIIMLPIVIATTALSTAVIPYFSQMVALNDWKGLQRSLKSYLGLIFAVTIPFTGLIILFSEQIVRLLLQRGSFNADNTHLVAQIQACFALEIPFYIGCILVVRLLSSMRNNTIIMWGSACNLIVNISLNYILMQWLGVVGIALSTSFVYLFSFVFLLFFLHKDLQAVAKLELATKEIE